MVLCSAELVEGSNRVCDLGLPGNSSRASKVGSFKDPWVLRLRYSHSSLNLGFPTIRLCTRGSRGLCPATFVRPQSANPPSRRRIGRHSAGSIAYWGIAPVKWRTRTTHSRTLLHGQLVPEVRGPQRLPLSSLMVGCLQEDGQTFKFTQNLEAGPPSIYRLVASVHPSIDLSEPCLWHSNLKREVLEVCPWK